MTRQGPAVFTKLSIVVKAVGFLLSMMAVVSLSAVVFIYGWYRVGVPDALLAKDYRPSLKSKVFAQNGEIIAEFGVHERIMVDRHHLTPLIKQAFVASEDKKFYSHRGIDFLGVINAVIQSMTGQRSTLRGASTITQQLAKNLLIKLEGYEKATARTLSRKVKEAILARRLEMNLSKEDILYIYLNDVYLGHGAYGVAAGANNYFRKSLKDLSLGEIAVLAGLPQAPSRYSPQNNMSAALARQSYVLGRMVDDGYVSASDRDEALLANSRMKVFELKNSFRRSAPYFAEMVRQMVIEEYGEETVYEKGLHIYTTLDLEHASTMRTVLKNGLLDIDKRQGFSGPIYRGKDAQSLKELIKEINDDDRLQLGQYRLATVDRIDNKRDMVFVDLGSDRGVIPLAGLRWARAREAKHNYAWNQLRSVLGVLQKNDVVLVKARSIKELKRMVPQSWQKNALDEQVGELISEQGEISLYSLEQEPSIEGAMLSLESDSGYVTALSGGYSFDKSEFNRVSQACRQPGSVFKPVVYSAAIALKKFTPATMVMDTPLTFHDAPNEFAWKPKNFGHKYRGEVTVREAVMRSMNVPTLNVMASVGIKNVLRFAKKLGIETPLKPELGTAIGSSCVTLWELSKVFSAIANMGEVVEPILIKEIVDRDHRRIKFNASKSDPWIDRSDRVLIGISDVFAHKPRVLDEKDAYTMHYLLTETARAGTARGTTAIGRDIAGKTGTTNDSFDVWFAGYSKELISLVWVGNDTMDVPLGVYEQGARTALPLFNQYMTAVLNGLPEQEWYKPASMCDARIDIKTGLRLKAEHPLSFVAPFRCGRMPTLLDERPHESLEQVMEAMGGM